jgi:hypothetical protein
MAVKNLQTLVCVANIHGRGTGMECMDSKRAFGQAQASPSLPWLPRPGSYPASTMRPDADLRADNAAAAQAVQWAGRSTGAAALLARSASRTVLSERSFQAMAQA